MTAVIRMLLRHLNRFRGDHRGAVLVEMTLITPLMLVLSAGVFEFGNLIHDKLLMEAGLSDGARYAARCNSQMYTDAGLAAINCADIASNIAVFGKAVVGVSGVPDVPRVSGWQKSGGTSNNATMTIAASGSCHNAVESGVTKYRSTTAQVCIVRADGSYPYTGVGMLAFIGIGPITLHGTHEERLIRF
ncbi:MULTISPECIES: TadE/TadG family type IV pilus assembly protein [Mesorhizobium]|uniref:Pilus assembly protein n=1 Tax=Mesorhizobium ciceri TaxID=39645 RepID=A0AB38TAH8_9HYPH|nr:MULTISPECIES: TadE/TadG family type IV pilus assembly protein [Mesorhizobium]MDF3214369.1 pilus assembly protein [Mesorhizobium ciceri]UTU51578.1 pilus assembly protein [Mesorhizobium ciceri]